MIHGRSHLLLLAALGVMLCAACNNVPVVDSQAPASSGLKENLINANRFIAQSEETQIDAYAQRRGWQMATLPCGARVMVTEEGKGNAVKPDEVLIITYRLEAINGAVIYDNVTDTVVAGRLEPTRGLDAALLTLRHGSRASVILPSEEAYGVVGDGDRIGQRMVLVYDVKVMN